MNVVTKLASSTSVAIALVVLVSPQAIAQSASARPGGPQAPGQTGERVTLTRSVEPAFHIEPIVHRFKARRGEVIPFTFEIASLGKSMNVTVTPVCLRQEETGVILHSTEAMPTDAVTLTSPKQFPIAPGESHQITGEVTVPIARTNYLSYGLLVVDSGQMTNKGEGEDENKTSASVKFVTQYVLRIDIETGSKDLSEMNRLVFEDGNVRAVNGAPVAVTYLSNPTDFAFECQVIGTIDSGTGTRPQPFRFGLPSRASVPGNERFLVRVMPGSRVRLEAAVNSLLMPGKQTLNVRLTNGRRSMVNRDFAFTTRYEDFPALAAQLAFLGDQVSVQPSQIAVGRIAGVNRTCALKFTNNSGAVQTVHIQPIDLAGNPLAGLRVSDKPIELKPGRTRTIRASVESSDIDRAVFGHIQVTIDSEKAGARTQKLPLAMLFAIPPAANVVFGELQSVDEGDRTEFRLMVTNNGSGHTPVHVGLQVSAAAGHAIHLADGYGRWLAPGETREMRFAPEVALPAGRYQLQLNMFMSPDKEPETRTLNVQLGEAAAEPSEADAAL